MPPFSSTEGYSDGCWASSDLGGGFLKGRILKLTAVLNVLFGVTKVKFPFPVFKAVTEIALIKTQPPDWKSDVGVQECTTDWAVLENL